MTDRIRDFYSHHSVDTPRVKTVAEWLAAAGIAPGVDTWEIAPVTTSSRRSTRSSPGAV